jgi:DNA-binding response OmpR family regulator
MNVVAAVADLFFSSRLQDLARRSDVPLTIAPTLAKLQEALALEQPALVLVDLSARGLDPIEAVRLAKNAGVAQVVAFGPHKDLAARSAALAAGADRWLTNQQLVSLNLRLSS